MEILHNYSLKFYNTFGINVYAENFIQVNNLDELREALANLNNKPVFILGGGSNVLFTKNISGFTIKMNIPGIEVVKEDEEFYYINANAGENWHQFVMYCVDNNYGGLENLSFIPGQVGAGPMQNIGAYGVELQDVFVSLKALNIVTGEVHIFSKSDCEFGYRQSVFKTKAKGNYVILSVMFRLTKKPVFNTSYGVIEQELEKMGVNELSIKAISQAVINIRRSKLPDPAEIGNAGSFFKNPVVSQSQFEILKNAYPSIPNYPQENGEIKLAAGWLIEQAGWKGKTIGNFGVHKNQALVLVNYGGASGQEIYELSETIMQDIFKKYGVTLEREVNIL